MWTLNNIRIFVQQIQDGHKQIIARLHPIDAGTIHHTFGYEDPIYRVQAIVVGSGDKGSLETLTTTGSTYTLSGPDGAVGTFLVNSLNFNRIPSICQTLRGDLASDAAVYNVDIELYKE